MFDSDLQAFYQYLISEKRYSEHTLSNYRRDILRFREYCESQQVHSWDTIDNQHVRQFASQSYRQGLSGKSIQRQLSSLRSLFKFLLKHKKISANPALGITAPKTQRKLPEVLSPDDLNHLLMLDENDPLAVRDMAMMELLYGCGLRLSELTSLNKNQIDWQNKTLLVIGKGRKHRLIPFGKKACRALENWMKIRLSIAKENEDAVFVSKRGCRISSSSVQQRLKKWGLEKGLDRQLYPHLMR
ncbi:MAG: tyrosine-type recombinase/integrase, partial [Gammaproteobacteria bacterium]|nr:tyrosine-type recombinase/integrase [Gammaproteobacteria bacterium]